MKILQDFKKFAVRGNVIDMAVGITVGVAFTGVVNSLVKDVLMPPLGLLLGNMDFSSLGLQLKPAVTDSAGKVVREAVTLRYGVFINSLVSFLIIALAVFALIKLVQRFLLPAEPAKPAAPSKQETLLEEIRDLLKQSRP